jgi:S-(hydroxymethyl)glutathione dehydrogenase/alcohol dehydrogenase
MGPADDLTIKQNSMMVTLWQKRIQGALFGSANPLYDIPRLLALYRTGDLKLDELISRRYRLEQVNQGYEDMLEGRNIRGVIEFE